MTNTPITPAMTSAEWTQVHQAEAGDYNMAITAYGVAKTSYLYNDRTHALAALCLHNQPFGFTREMLEALERHVRWGEIHAEERFFYDDEDDRAALVNAKEALARIEALLPPEI